MTCDTRASVAEPRVSVICIFLDEERFLAEAVESVLTQAYDDYELLLVDDGSTDGSTRIARDYAERFPGRVAYLEHERHANRGMSATRNLGLARARGEYVAFIDADDRWRAGKLADQTAILDAHPDVGMVCGTVNYWRSWDGGGDRLVPTGRPIDGVSRPPDTALALYPLGPADAPSPSDCMVRRSLVEAVGGFEEQFTGMYEDQAFFAKVYLAAPVYFSSRIWLDYRLHAESCSSRVMRAGGLSAARGRFLDWYESLLESRRFSGQSAVARAVRRARWRLAHPVAAGLERRIRRLARSLTGNA